jgi:polo-like kinase 1
MEMQNPQSMYNNYQHSTKEVEEPIYVKKWMKTKHAIMFRLSNKIVQVDFQDKTQVILNSGLKEVTYINKKMEKQKYSLSAALETTNPEMSKRLKYTKDILTHIISSGGKHHQEENKII